MCEPAIKRAKVDVTDVLAVLAVNTESTYGQFKACLCGERVCVCVCIFVFLHAYAFRNTRVFLCTRMCMSSHHDTLFTLSIIGPVLLVPILPHAQSCACCVPTRMQHAAQLQCMLHPDVKVVAQVLFACG